MRNLEMETVCWRCYGEGSIEALLGLKEGASVARVGWLNQDAMKALFRLN
jgi:hypothetical protein